VTLIGLKRLENLRRCVEEVLDSGVPGDLIETGVWKGGTSMLMKSDPLRPWRDGTDGLARGLLPRPSKAPRGALPRRAPDRGAAPKR
jgi:hypothetical protein